MADIIIVGHFIKFSQKRFLAILIAFTELTTNVPAVYIFAFHASEIFAGKIVDFSNKKHFFLN